MEPLLDGHAVKRISMHIPLLRVPSTCMAGCFNQDPVSQVTERVRRVTAVCLHRLCGGSVPCLSSARASFSSTRGTISEGFSFFLLLFSFWFTLIHFCAQGDKVGGGKERQFPLFCRAEHRTTIFLLEPGEWADLNNGLCVLICVGIYSTA